MSFSALLVGEDALGGGEDEVSELPGGEDVAGPLLEVGEENVVPGRDDSDPVDPADELDDDLLAPVIIDDLKLTNVVVLLHDPEEFDQHLGHRLQQHLLLPLALGVDDRPECVREDVYFHHFCG